MRSLEEIISRNAKAAGREAAHADSDYDDRLTSAIHSANCEHGASDYCGEIDCIFTREEHRYFSITHAFVEQPHDPQLDGPDVIDQGALWFTTGFCDGRKDG